MYDFLFLFFYLDSGERAIYAGSMKEPCIKSCAMGELFQVVQMIRFCAFDQAS